MTRSSRVETFVRVFAVGLPLMLAPLAEAETIHCGAGDVQCLIAALNQASADPQHKTTIRLAGGTYALMDVDNNIDGPNGLPLIVSTVTIDGGTDGATLTAASGAPNFLRILHIGASGRLTLQRVTITNPAGQALYNNHGMAIISDSTFTGNVASLPAGVLSDGGAVDITRTVFEHNSGRGAGALWSTGADVRITESRFSHNSAGLGAGGIVLNGGTASITATTFEGNSGDCCGSIIADSVSTLVIRDSAFVENLGFLGGGGGLSFLGGTADVINTTFARNSSANFGGTQGVAIRNIGGSMTVLNSTFAENPGFGGGGSVIASLAGATTLLENTILVHDSDDPSAHDCEGAVTSLGSNVIDDPFSCNVTMSDWIGDAGLGELVDDGTPGNAHFPLLPDSQAIDTANDTACPKKDQIDQPRKPKCDIGAIEFQRADVTAATE